MGVYTTTEDVAFNELIELHNKTAETEIKRITGNAISMIQGKNGQIWELLCEIDSLEDRIKEQEAKPPRVHENTYGRKFYYCPKCNRTFDYFNQETYCHDCGQAVKWE